MPASCIRSNYIDSCWSSNQDTSSRWRRGRSELKTADLEGTGDLIAHSECNGNRYSLEHLESFWSFSSSHLVLLPSSQQPRSSHQITPTQRTRELVRRHTHIQSQTNSGNHEVLNGFVDLGLGCLDCLSKGSQSSLRVCTLPSHSPSHPLPLAIISNFGHIQCSALAQDQDLQGKVYSKDNSFYDARLETYYSANAAQAPWCMVLPESTSDVTKIAKILNRNQCPFGIRSGAHSAFTGSNGVKKGVTIDFGKHLH